MAQAVNPQSPSQPLIQIPAFVFNLDVTGIANRLGRFVTELIRSNSSNLAAMSGADQARLTTYLNAVDAYTAHVIAAPILDLPETSHLVQWPVEPLDLVPDMENEDTLDLVRLLMLSHAELCNSASARQSSNLVSFDAARLTAIIAKARDFLNNYIGKNSPMDLPASQPLDAITPVARVGI